ncbi:IS110 family transposase [Actinoplanes xinjiangensis]|uniref:IS110 family transposase n=1 Tax=Actinoplanes xinjiangensis TaxID=512350 RepID=UPI003444A77F
MHGGDQSPQGSGRVRPRGPTGRAARHGLHGADIALRQAAGPTGPQRRASNDRPRCAVKAVRIQALRTEADELEVEITALVAATSPELLELPGTGPIGAGQILVSWSHTDCFRSEAAFASFAGTALIPASSGLTNRYRLNRTGDRQLNRALHTIVLIRMRIDPTTKAFIQHRVTEGRSPREARRCLKRAVARQVFKLLERRPVEKARRPPTMLR